MKDDQQLGVSGSAEPEMPSCWPFSLHPAFWAPIGPRPSGTPAAKEAYDELSIIWGLLYLLAILATGILWMIWQYRAAANAGPGALRRKPVWHAWSWAIPVIAIWFPYQNISDLHRVTGTRTSGQGMWWVLWLMSGLLFGIANQLITLDSPRSRRC